MAERRPTFLGKEDTMANEDRTEDRDPAARARQERNRHRREAEAKSFRKAAFGTTGKPEDEQRAAAPIVAQPVAPLTRRDTLPLDSTPPAASPSPVIRR